MLLINNILNITYIKYYFKHVLDDIVLCKSHHRSADQQYGSRPLDGFNAIAFSLVLSTLCKYNYRIE